ncbi:hypothetical protein BKH42_07005 [Helicobacter sp. 13S00482-2]|uniref:outer membrane protein n=1 Tax=Helicobacter sp. 13S00482-2 TaxID=1476200 RepID=UPI000BA63934|nr:outer membrane protein [Helicobacter sp. 13S00482-2]PAF53268.1 hypothetical protein BKH42_07005 [Helicobacter sp. 13S00482-2]
MKKILTGALCSLTLASFAFGENSGVFVGVSYQFGQTNVKQSSSATLGGADVTSMAGGLLPNFNKKAYTNGAGLKIGYKQFFGQSKWFGLRYYAFLDYGHTDFGADILPSEKYHTDMFSYGVGIDTLWNVVNKEGGSLGIFAGVGVGADTWIANGKDYQNKYFSNGKPAYVSFQTTIDAGIRTNFAKHHGLEVGVKVPLLQDEIFKDIAEPFVINPKAPKAQVDTKTDVELKYSVYVSYLYTF